MDASGIQEGLRNINHFVIFAAMMKTVYTILFSFCLLLLSIGAYAQRISDSGYRTIGYIQSDGTIQDASYRIVGHADGIPLYQAAYYFFFRN